jgi:hypothetical protein
LRTNEAKKFINVLLNSSIERIEELSLRSFEIIVAFVVDKFISGQIADDRLKLISDEKNFPHCMKKKKRHE